MKFIVSIQPTVANGNSMIRDLKAVRNLEKEFKKFNAEAIYFYEFNGNKTFDIVMDIPKGSSMPEIVDPMFKKFKARITFQSVSTMDDLKKEIAKKEKKRESRSS